MSTAFRLLAICGVTFFHDAIGFQSLGTTKSSLRPSRRILRPFTQSHELELKSSLSTVFEQPRTSDKRRTATSVDRFVDAWNRRDVQEAITQFSDDAVFEDTTFPAAFVGKTEIKRHFILSKDALPKEQATLLAVENMAVSDCGTKVGITWQETYAKINEKIPNRRGIAFFNLDADTGLIQRAFLENEPKIKPAEISLAVLSAAGKFIEKTGINSLPPDAQERVDKRRTQQSSNGETEENDTTAWFAPLFGKGKEATNQSNEITPAERYFEAWNRRDMDSAIDLFSQDCEYEDTVFPKPFSGKDSLKQHLFLCADAFPYTFGFIVDDVANSKDGSLCVRWHVENNGEQLPFTRGCSFYNTDTQTGLINKGIDFLEPQAKLGGVKLALQSVVTKLTTEPVRYIPLALWVAYMYIVFFSDGILPGANALQLEQRTWEEVRDLSLNFFLVAPLLQLPFSPVVHPMLEGVFNLLLSWAALFACFLSDERDEKPNTLPMLPMVAGMQFLTSAFLLPYLVTRSSEELPKDGIGVYVEDLDAPGRIAGESRVLGPLLGSVGLGSIVWGVMGRFADFGDLSHRYASFIDLLSIDRVGSSFLVDLVIFALFQGWLVNDDMRRRGALDSEYKALRNVATFVPFFGLAAYSFFRPALSSKTDT